jgi:hypothetical protein
VNIKITFNKKKIASILDLILLGVNLFYAIDNFRKGSWTWGVMFAAFFLLSVYGTNKSWAWAPKKTEDGDDNDKTKDLKKTWRDKL